MLKIKVLAIVTDSKDVTIGAKLDVNGTVKSATTADLIRLYNSNIQYEITNAVLDCNGRVRGKKGINLPRIIFRPNAVQHRDQYNAGKILNEPEEVLLYHGTKELNLVPKFGIGKINNDYGQGFYTTPDKELAKEWAWGGYGTGNNPYVYTYKINLNGLKVLDLTRMSSAHWIAELMVNRGVNDVSYNMNSSVPEYIEKFKLDTSKYDIIIGYRADDRYFAFVQAFANSALTMEEVEQAARLGGHGLQVFIKSRLAFSRLKTVSKEPVDIKYKEKYNKRDSTARRNFDEWLRSKKRQPGRYIRKMVDED
jgi:hypothetical protein